MTVGLIVIIKSDRSNNNFYNWHCAEGSQKTIFQPSIHVGKGLMFAGNGNEQWNKSLKASRRCEVTVIVSVQCEKCQTIEFDAYCEMNAALKRSAMASRKIRLTHTNAHCSYTRNEESPWLLQRLNLTNILISSHTPFIWVLATVARWDLGSKVMTLWEFDHRLYLFTKSYKSVCAIEGRCFWDNDQRISATAPNCSL